MQAVQKMRTVDEGSAGPQAIRTLSSAAEGHQDKPIAKVSAELFRILVVEDDPSLQELYRQLLAGTNFSFDMSSSGHEALEKLSSAFYDLVVTDLNLPGLDGIALLRWIHRHRPATTAVVISGDGSADRILTAMREGAKDYLVKPIALPEFRKMLERWGQKQHHVNRHVFSSLMKQVMHDVRGEILHLEIMVKRLHEDKFEGSEDGPNSVLHAMQAKLLHMKELATEYCLLAQNLLQGGDIQAERLRLKEDVIAPVLEEMQDAMRRKEVGLSFRQDLEADDDICVTGNRVMLKCVFRVLFGNAINYCQTASVISYGISSNDRRFRVHVANVGVVVPAHMQASIFDEFVPAQPGDSLCQANGLGLGLALAKDILRRHGGDIWYEAMANGSKFVCTLPPCSGQSES